MGSGSKNKDGPWQTQKPKKTKGKKIVVGCTIGMDAQDSFGRTIPSNHSFQTGNYTIPRKKRPTPLPNNNTNTSTSTKGSAKNKNNWNHNQKKDPRVLSELCKDVNLGAVRAALADKSRLPEKFKAALAETTLELNDRRQFVIQKAEASSHVYSSLRNMLGKNHLPGWLEWLQGKRGWLQKIEKEEKELFIDYHRGLHEFYDKQVKALREKAKKGDKQTRAMLRLLVYKDTLDGEQSQQTVWKKVGKNQSLYDAVGMARPFLEVLRYLCTDPEEKWTSLPWLMPTITLTDCKNQLRIIHKQVQTLMRSSDWGPDVPLHWAAHPPRNGYPRSVVTPAIMEELIVGIANILSKLFLPHPIRIMNLGGVDKLLGKSSAARSEDLDIALKGLSISEEAFDF